MNLKIGLLYLSLHNQLKKKVGLNGIISRKDLLVKLGRHSQLSKRLGDVVIIEMMKLKMLKKVEKGKYKLLNSHLDISKEADRNKIFQMIGLY